MLRVVLRSYGGENVKGRPAWYSKELSFASFLRAVERAFEVLHDDVSVSFVNDGPIDPGIEASMREFAGGVGRRQFAAPAGVQPRHGAPSDKTSPTSVEVVEIPDGPVGTQPSYVFALDLPDARGWADDDVVVYVEDDYLLTRDALVAVAEAAEQIAGAGYFALAHGRPDDLRDPVQRTKWGTVEWWNPAPDRQVGGRTWINILGVTSTFAARVGALRADRDIFDLCRRPFRKRWFDHETAMLYQAVVPYRGMGYLTGMSGDFVPGARGVLRAVYLLPFRFAVNARARRQRRSGGVRYLYAPAPHEAAHLELALMEDVPRWQIEAAGVVAWARTRGLPLRGHEIDALPLPVG